MSFFRHREIFPNDPGATLSDYARAHRPDESPVGYSSAGCSPASPASALPTGSQCALNSSCWSTDFHRTANCVLTVCLTPGGRPKKWPWAEETGLLIQPSQALRSPDLWPKMPLAGYLYVSWRCIGQRS